MVASSAVVCNIGMMNYDDDDVINDGRGGESLLVCHCRHIFYAAHVVHGNCCFLFTWGAQRAEESSLK